jgi:hypothetical protein
LPSSIEEAEKLWWKQPKLFWSASLASKYHQDKNIEWIELKYVSIDWHKEIIFTQNSQIISSDEYMGTYNFFSPSKKVMHTLYDVQPYNEWWNTPNY